MKDALVPIPARHAGERRAFSRVADSCSAADAACLRRIRDERLYRLKKMNWSQFCPQHLDIGKTDADRIIRRFEEFGQSYFDVSRIVRISPESFRAIADAIKDKAIEFDGETIPLTSENSQRIAAAVQALRQAAAPAPPLPLSEHIDALQRRAYEIDTELRSACARAGRGGYERQVIGRLARDLRQRMNDLEVLAA